MNPSNRKTIFSFLFLALFSCQPPHQTQSIIMNDTSIIPKPNSTQILNTTFDLKSIKGIILKNESQEERHIGEIFQAYLNPAVSLSISKSSSESNIDHIIISLDESSEIPDEGYELNVGEHHRIELTASSSSFMDSRHFGNSVRRNWRMKKHQKTHTSKISKLQITHDLLIVECTWMCRDISLM